MAMLTVKTTRLTVTICLAPLVMLVACGTSGASRSPPLASLTPSPTGPIGSPTLASPAPSALAMREVVPPTASPPDREGAIGLDWAEVHADPDEVGTMLVKGPAGWMYELYDDSGFPSPHLKLSADMATWSDVRPAREIDQISSLAATGTTYLCCDGLWRSTDGHKWERIDATFIGGSAPDRIAALASDGRMFVGWHGEFPSSEGVWTSTDGQTWTMARLPGAAHVLVDVVLGRRPSGGFLIAGRVGETASELDDAVIGMPRFHRLAGRQGLWRSDDGVTWTSLVGDGTFDGSRITDIGVGGPGGGVVAAGLTGETNEGANVVPLPTVWRSRDLVSWEHLVGPVFALEESNIGATRVVGSSERWLVLSSRGMHQPIGVVAGSDDGDTWWTTDPIRLEPNGMNYAIHDVVTESDQLVVLGELVSPLDTDQPGARIWLSPPNAE
jgi:hypothetical protein